MCQLMSNCRSIVNRQGSQHVGWDLIRNHFPIMMMTMQRFTFHLTKEWMASKNSNSFIGWESIKIEEKIPRLRNSQVLKAKAD